MYMMRLLFTLDGTIKRGEWWLGSLVIVAATLASMIAFAPEVFSDSSSSRTMPKFVLVLVFAYPSAALMVKRIADIGWPSQVGYAAVALSMLLLLLDYPGIFASGTFDGALLAANLVFAMIEIVVCGCLKGNTASARPPSALQAA